MLHLVMRSMGDLDGLPAGSWIGVVRAGVFEPYVKDTDGAWWNHTGSWQLDPDHLIWGARILHVPGLDEAVSELAQDDPIAAAAAVIAKAQNVPFVGPTQRRIATALSRAGMLGH